MSPSPPRFPPAPASPHFPRPLFPPAPASPPPPPPKKKKKKNLWSPFSYKLPVISSPTRTLLRQRYICFAFPPFFLLCYRYSKCTKKKTPLQKEWSFWLCCQAKKTLNCHGEIFIFARCISVVRVSGNYPDICSLWCLTVSEGKLLQEWFNWESVSGAADRTNFQNPKIAEDVMLPSN